MNDNHTLRRDITLWGAVMLGLGSIVGTGVFVSIGVAAGVAGPNVLVAIFLASLVAICNGLSSAQLAAAHPVSGGTYEYGYRWLNPTWGFVAGWLFLCAKSASAATAALGLAGYLRYSLGLFESWDGTAGYLAQVGLAESILALMLVLVLVGIKRTTLINSIIVGVTLVSLGVLVLFGFASALEHAGENLQGVSRFESWVGDSERSVSAMLGASALMFVAFTGYGRIATLGEEVSDPRRTIPRAMILTLIITMTLYLAVGFVAVAVVGADALSSASGQWAAPLMLVAEASQHGWLKYLLGVGATTAMLGVLLNLLLGLSRVVLAMSRRDDLPGRFAKINQVGVPAPATLLVALVIGALVCLGDVRLSWSISALTVLIYYAITNWCALRVEVGDRIFPKWPAWIGLIGCLSLAVFIQWPVLLVGTAVVGGALLWRSWLSRK